MWLPADKVAIWKVALPWRLSVSTGLLMVPSMVNWTEPVGIPVPVAGRTWAVKVMVCPRFAVGVRLLVTTVVVRLSTFWVSTELVLPVKLPSPVYTAVML